MVELNKIYNMDCVEGMKLLPDNCIDLVVTSPPYDEIRDYKGFKLDLHNVGREISRILKDGGMCVMVIQDQTKNGRKSGTSFRTIVDWIDNTELDLWECCIYQRRATPGNWWSKRFSVDHEYIPIFIKGKRPQYFNKEHMMIEGKLGGKVKKSGVSMGRSTNGDIIYANKQVKYNEKICCGTILPFASSSREGNGLFNTKEGHKIKLQHPATFPDKLASDFIQCFTTEGMIVLDPFMGSGTVAAMAKKLNRNYIGFEISKEYCDIAEQRLKLLI